MKVLAIESSGLTASVAVVEETRTVAEYTVDYKKTHSQTLLPMIDEVVRMTDLDLSEINAIAVSGGPGSFTGLRIGSATAKGLGLALDKPLIHVPTVDGLAYQVYGCRDIICPIMDARRNQVYTGIYTFSASAGKKEGTREVDPVFQVLRMQMAIAVEDLIRRLNNYNRPVVFLGDGVPVYREMLSAGLKVPYSFAPSYMNRQRAAVVGALGIRYYQAGKYETAMEHQPEYLRQSQAERERAQREKTAKLVIRELKAEDAAAAAEIEYQSFPDPWSQNGILDTVSNPSTVCLLAEKAGKAVGYLFAYKAGDEAEIARIAVAGEQKRQGVGKSLMRTLEEIGKKKQIRRLLLDVRESNREARAFYEKMAFQEDGVRRGFYQDPPEDAVLMSREL
ncbi:tRNA (adenosine(37)-N6)-threonylcarbamoyltransferase complex dimerization subunit type 1 TsaB [Lachnospiraceae bacterium]|nr:tRNA (adenosine(37)-N6)-threonylcarbamoyltransferase complex dimerization subunit type 1 TsaB [uncultured Schaedlerella sp.]EOS38565.1 universal bacterial protein YeaZ [Lachnospiraceae bacterium M18-1]MCI9152278.1 tRNA (adenosine(37)-N6)-threonylcarbamoyltransferase complex dimerization subunit type 1 TsaB [Ruminococcus sp.]NBI57955.1 tRNA (adenosine(37)-N6)-threonylcarbamoyltransferase complex dimerization subunit type 1 TsaB [Lachnospiraceae bacterium]